jgi:hypothetical protein
MPNTQYPTPNTQRPTPNTQYPIPNTQYPIPNTQHPTPNIQYPIPNTQYPIPNTQYPIPNTQPNTQHPTPNLPPFMKPFLLLFVGWAFLFLNPLPVQSQTDYTSHREMTARLQALSRANPNLAKLESLTKTLGGKDIWLLTVGSGDVQKRPAIAIVGGVAGDHLLGAELALQFAERLLSRAGEPETRQLLESATFYVFPDMSPDAREQYFAPLRYERLGNANPSDYDRDGKTGEDPYNDLNGDGLITLMRVRDPRGEWMVHPEDNRIMVRARPELGQRGEYFLFSEGIDQDKDGLFNEDGDEGVIFNRNFTFKYPAFKAGAGENAVSEKETRAIADFLFDAKNVFAVVSFGPPNNLREPLRYNEREAGGRIPAGWQESDIRINQMISLAYNRNMGVAGAAREGEQGTGPASGRQDSTSGDAAAPGRGVPGTDGDFFQWAYFHYGRFSFSSPGWWVPADPGTRGARGAGDQPGRGTAPGDAAGRTGAAVRSAGMQMGGFGGMFGRPPLSREEIMDGIRQGGGAPEIDAQAQLDFLRWADKEGLDRVFVPWTRVDHPDFPGKEVEVGGIVPFAMKNPPYEMVDQIAGKHVDFIVELAHKRPQTLIENIRTETLGNNLFRVTVDIVNKGAFPTVSQMGQRNRWVQKTVVRANPGRDQELISGRTVEVIDEIEGYSSTERSWLVRGRGEFVIRAGAESSGISSQTINLR